MRAKNLIDKDPKWLDMVADYHIYLRENERSNLSQSIITHNALRYAGRNDEADRLTLDYIVGPFTRMGFYTTLLTETLPSICDSKDQQVKGEALGQTGALLIHIGQYEKVLSYLKQALAIKQQIGDKEGLCVTLFNIGHIHAQDDQIQEAINAWVTVYVLAKQMNLAQVLNALSELAPQLGMPEGLEGWENLAQQIQNEQSKNQN